MNPRRAGSLRTSCAALGALSVLVLAGCAEQGPAAGGDAGEGVGYGATESEYRAAFAQVDPIVLNTQTPAPKGSITGSYVEKYLEAVTAWSDGKITFDVAYSNAIAPPAEIDDALADGRLDLGMVLPIYEPAEYPANAALIESSFISDHSVITGTLHQNAWPLEVAYDTPEIMREFEERGAKLLLPTYTSGSNGILCSSPHRDLDALKGTQISVGGAAGVKEVEGLGAAPVSVVYTELFESLQRGVIDCSLTSLNVATLAGIVEVAPHVVIDPDAGFALAPGGMAISQATWDSLPLVAQQLMFDRMDVFIKANIVDKIWPSTVEASNQTREAGGSIEVLADDARDKLNEANDALLDKLRTNKAVGDGDAFVERVQEASDKWKKIVTDELGFENEVDYNGFGSWYSEEKLDIDPYVERVFEEIFLDHRPS